MSQSPQEPTEKFKPNLSGPQETLLAILDARAIDARSANPILNDQYAAQIVDKLDYNFAKLGMDAPKAAVLAVRAKYLDRWAAEALQQARQQGEPVTVLHLAAGLDTRALRLQDACGDGNGKEDEEPLVRWVDVDLLDVVEVRRRLRLPEPDAARMRYELVGADVTDEGWLGRLGLPRDRRTFVVFEGLTMYLQPEQGRALVEALTSYFVGGGGRNQMAFDCLNWFPLLVQRIEPIVSQTGSKFSWPINDSRELEGWHEGLRLRDDVWGSDNPENVNLPAIMKWPYWLASWIPGLRTMARFVRYEW